MQPPDCLEQPRLVEQPMLLFMVIMIDNGLTAILSRRISLLGLRDFGQGSSKVSAIFSTLVFISGLSNLPNRVRFSESGKDDTNHRWIGLLAAAEDVIAPSIISAAFKGYIGVPGYRWAPRAFLQSVEESKLAKFRLQKRTTSGKKRPRIAITLQTFSPKAYY